MKKRRFILLLIGLCFGLMACGTDSAETASVTPTPTATEDASVVTGETGTETNTEPSTEDAGIQVDENLRIPDYTKFAYYWNPFMDDAAMEEQMTMLTTLYEGETEITDEWIQKHFSDYKTVSEYKEAVQNTYFENAKAAAEERARELVTDQLYSKTEYSVDFDEEVTEREMALRASYAEEAVSDGLTMEEFCEQHFGVSESDFYRELFVTAKKQIIVYEAVLGIAKLENITVSDEEYSELFPEYRKNDKSYQGLSDEDYELLVGKETIRANMLYEKTFDYVVDLTVQNGELK